MAESFITANGIRFHLVEEGLPDGPLAILLHGFPECWYSWRSQLPLLAHMGYRAVAPDLRGYNTSDKPPGVKSYHLLSLAQDVRELARALGREHAVVVGHDWGAIIAWRTAMEYPALVERLVILNVPHPGVYRQGMLNPRQWLRSWYIGAFQVPWLPEWFLTREARRVVRGIRASMVHPGVMTETDVEVYVRAIQQPGAMHAAVNYYRAFVRWGLTLPVKPISAPTLMIWGEHDPALGKDLTYGTEKFVADFRIHYIPSAAHWVQQEAAGEVNRQLADFLGPAGAR